MWPWNLKIHSADFTDVTLAIDDTDGDDVRGPLKEVVVYMGVDKVIDDMADMEVDNVADSGEDDWWYLWRWC